MSNSEFSEELKARPWRFELLGSLRLRYQETPIPFRSRKERLLLAFLALEPLQEHSRDVLMERLWPDAPDPANSLRVTLTRLKAALSAFDGDLPLEIGRQTLRLKPQRIACDIWELDRLHRTARHLSDEQAEAALTDAAHLYQGPVLPEFDAFWIEPYRQQRLDQHVQTLRRLLKHLSRQGRTTEAIEVARRLIEVDPLQEGPQRDLMRLYLQIDRPAAARGQYHQLVTLLQRELGAEPEEATQRLAQRFLQDPSLPSPTVPATVGNSPRQPDSLPATPTNFIGREDEVRLLTELVLAAPSRLVTVLGMPGVGKTRLSIEVARRIRDAFPGGTFFVPLAEISEVQALSESVRRAIQAPVPAPDEDPIQSLAGHLGEAATLLVLDNLEHLLPHAALPLAQLRDQAPHLRLLITSRQRAAIVGEQLFPLLPLAAPPETDQSHQIHTVPSVKLWLDRARLQRPDFQLDRRNTRSVSLLCQQLEGLPLAIELAASWAHLLSPSQMLERLRSRRFDLMANPPVGGIPGVAPRALGEAIEASYRLLSPTERQTLIYLCTLNQQFTMNIASAICGKSSTSDVLSLAQGSLIDFDNDTNTISILSSICQYVLDSKSTNHDRLHVESSVVHFVSSSLNHEITHNVSNDLNCLSDFITLNAAKIAASIASQGIDADWIAFNINTYCVKQGYYRVLHALSKVMYILPEMLSVDTTYHLYVQLLVVVSQQPEDANAPYRKYLETLSRDSIHHPNKTLQYYMAKTIEHLLTDNDFEIILSNILILPEDDRHMFVLNFGSHFLLARNDISKYYALRRISINIPDALAITKAGLIYLDTRAYEMSGDNIDVMRSVQQLDEAIKMLQSVDGTRYCTYINIHRSKAYHRAGRTTEAIDISIENLTIAIQHEDVQSIIGYILNVLYFNCIPNTTSKSDLIMIAHRLNQLCSPVTSRQYASQIAYLIQNTSIDEHISEYTNVVSEKILIRLRNIFK